MQNRYTGDVGDFAKYGLMRQFSGAGFRTALSWYLFPDENHNADGKHIAYIGRDEFKKCDPKLHDQMERLVNNNQRNINAVEKSKILGINTQFHNEVLDLSTLPSSSGKVGRQQRTEKRKKWLSDCVSKTDGADIVFFDPDNGIEGSNPKPLSNKGAKFLYWSDLDWFTQKNQSLVIYNHASRQGTVTEQISRRLELIKKHVPYGSNAVAMLWRRFGVRYFLVIPTDEKKNECLSVCKEMVDGPWGQKKFFELVENN